MKLRTLFFTALLGLGVLAPVTSVEASPHCERTRVTYDHCGRPIYWAYRVVSYNCHGCPVYAWVRISHSHSSSHHGSNHDGHSGHYSGGHSSRWHGYRGSYCDR